MPLRHGNLTSLAKDLSKSCIIESLCKQVLEQILKALDYLAFNQLCHRDVKPDNILYIDRGEWTYHFQLADFGFANHHRLATTMCGTAYFQAPELYPQYGNFPQSPKMDVWSLFASIIAVIPGFNFPPPNAKDYDDVLQAVRATVPKLSALRAMARENPMYQATAAQILVDRFGGQGLTTPREKVPPIEEPPQVDVSSQVLDNRQQGGTAPAQVPRVPAPTRLIVYQEPKRRRRQPALARQAAGPGALPSRKPPPYRARSPEQQEEPPPPFPQPIPAHRDGVVKRRGESARPGKGKESEKEFPVPGRFPD